MSRTKLLLVGAVALVVAGLVAVPASASGGRAGEATYRVTVHNVTDGQYLTPPNFAAHGRGTGIFTVGRKASPGLQAVAENGAVPVLAAELMSKVDRLGLGTSGVGGDAPIGPGGSVTWDVTASANVHRFSLAAMVICTNDGFAGLSGRRMPFRVGHTVSYDLPAYDAGTEVNTELDADLVPAPPCLGDQVGSGESNPALAENGRIGPHGGIVGVGDLGPEFDWDGPVATLTIERIG